MSKNSLGPLDEKRIMIRTTEAFHQVLRSIAKENKRSLNNQLLEILEEYAAKHSPAGTVLPPSRPPSTKAD